MGNINFYDWRREEADVIAKLNQLFLFGCFIIAVGICALLFMLKDNELNKAIKAKKFIEKQEEIMDNIKDEIKVIEESKELIISKINVIKDLQKERPILVYSLDEMTTAIPENAYLVEMGRIGNQITMKGVALTNEDVGDFINNIENTKTFSEPRIMDIKKIKKNGFLDSVEFNILANIDTSNENVIEEEAE